MDSSCLLEPLDDVKEEFGSPYLELLRAGAWSGSKTASEGRKKRSRDCSVEGAAETRGTTVVTSNPGRVQKNKASREKARRERINDRFCELAKLCDPDEPKSDKSSILLDAIRVVKQQRIEMDQLRQLNKFLEARVGQHEKERDQFFLCQSMLMQPQLQGRGMPGNFMSQEVPTPVVPNPTTANLNMAPVPGNLGFVPQCGTAMGIPVGDCKPQGFPTAPSTVEAGVWPQACLSNESQDHLLRPPAA